MSDSITMHSNFTLLTTSTLAVVCCK